MVASSEEKRTFKSEEKGTFKIFLFLLASHAGSGCIAGPGDAPGRSDEKWAGTKKGDRHAARRKGTFKIFLFCWPTTRVEGALQAQASRQAEAMKSDIQDITTQSKILNVPFCPPPFARPRPVQEKS
jgi:hypothetical protein